MDTIILAASGNTVTPFVPAIIETQDAWGDGWTVNTELELVSFNLKAGSGEVSTAEFRRRYGRVKEPYEDDMPTDPRSALDLAETWVRISFPAAGGSTDTTSTATPIVQFVGVVDGQTAVLQGVTPAPSGIQTWVASGGMRFLQKLKISESLFINGSTDSPSLVQWLPAMNARDAHGMLVGNRSAAQITIPGAGTTSSTTFVYGGVGPSAATWTHLDYLYYLVTAFIQRPDGPVWSVGGQTDILAGMTTTVEFGHAETALEMIRKLIPPKYGVDFTVLPTDTGYTIFVFALIGAGAVGTSVNGVNIPINPNTVTIVRDQNINLFECHLVESFANRVDSIRMLGQRITVCGTLLAGGTASQFVPKWSPTLEAEYLAEVGDVDFNRERDKYRDVYRKFGAPVGWDMDAGTWAMSCDLTGVISEGDTASQYQTVIRETLHALPMREGFDYSTNPPTDQTLATSEPEFKAPLAWIYDPAPEDGSAARYVACHRAGIGVHISPHDWGLYLEANPNHLIALTTATASSMSSVQAHYDYNTLVATIAITADHRLQLGYDVPAELAAGDGSVMTVVDDGAELWAILPGTVYDVNSSGSLLTTPSIYIARNDTPRLALAMAGLVSRYVNERVKGRFVFKGFLDFSKMIGSILTVVQQGDVQTRVGAPITSIEWVVGKSPMTSLGCGYG